MRPCDRSRPVGQAGRRDRLQRVGGHPADAVDGVRAHCRPSRRALPRAAPGEIETLNEHIYDNVNNAVYKAGFSTRQHVYEHEVGHLFATLDELDARLADRRFLFGPAPLETDWRLFTTLLRFDAVYQIHFKCSLRKLIEYEHLWPYTRDLYQWPGVADTVAFDEIRAHYYRTHPQINPSGLVAVRPAASFDDPPGRDHL